jgi:hypothetical protein
MNYHYSSLLHLPYILLSEELKASRKDAHGDHQAGLLWFSRNPVMEATAVKQNATPVRFASDADTIGPWQAVARSVGFSSGVMRRLMRSGRKMGAVPGQWRAMVGSLPLSAVTSIEVRYAGGWHAIERSTLHVDHVAGGAVRLTSPNGLVGIVIRQQTREGYWAYATNEGLCQPANLLPNALREAS